VDFECTYARLNGVLKRRARIVGACYNSEVCNNLCTQILGPAGSKAALGKTSEGKNGKCGVDDDGEQKYVPAV
ncbi:hypothetical protein MKW92_035741, partial [Papaver armeniacum]